MKLDDVNISYDQSSQWQKLAKGPEPAFEAIWRMPHGNHQPSVCSNAMRRARESRISMTLSDGF
jgi:hypothetical protein